MANILTVPASSAIYFSNGTAGSSTVPSLTTTGVALQYDSAAGINITNYSTSSTNRFSIDGANGRLFSVSDSLTGSIFSVNDAAGLPIIDVNSSATDVIKIGTYGTNVFVVNDTKVGIGTATPASKLDVSDTLLSGSGSLAASALSIAQTWNTSGTPTAIKLNVTDTASNASSLLMDLQVGGVSKFKVDKIGILANGNGSVGTGNNGTGWYASVGTNIRAAIYSSGTGGLSMTSGARIGWQDNANSFSGNEDLFLTKKAAGSLRLGAVDVGTTAVVTITAAAPAVVTWNSHGLSTGSPVRFTVAGGSLPVEIVSGTTYYAVYANGNTFNLAASFADALVGTKIATSAPISGTITGYKAAAAQTLGVQSASTQYDFRGADFVIAGSQGTGTAAGGSIIFQTAPASVSSSATQNALTTALTIGSNGTLTLGTALAITSGGTGATTVGSARTNLGLGEGSSPTFDNITLTSGASASAIPNTFALRDASEGSLYGTNIYCVGGAVENGYLKLYNPTFSDYASIYSTGSKIGLLPIQTTEGAIEFTHATRTPGPNPTNVTSVVFTNGLDETYTFPTEGGTLLTNTGNLLGLTSPSAARSILELGEGNSPTFKGLTLTSASLEANTPNTITQTWNSGTTAFTAVKVNAIGDPTSSASSLLLDLQLDSVSKFKFSKAGGLDLFHQYGSLRLDSTDYQQFNTLGNRQALLGGNSNGLSLWSTYAVGWSSSTTDAYQSKDLFLTRKNPASLRLGAADTTGTTAPVAQTLGVQSWASSTTADRPGATFTIAGSQGTGTGAGGSLLFQTAPAAASTGTTQNALVTAMAINSSSNVGIGTTTPIDKLHINSAGTSNIYLGTVGNNNGTHQIKYNFGEGIFAASIVGIATGANSSGNLELRVAGAGTGNAVQSDTGIRVTASDVQILKSLTYAQDVLAIGNNHNSGVKAFKFTRSENKAAIWSVPLGNFGRGDIRFTTGDLQTGTAKTEADATVIIARAGGLIAGNSYLSQQPTDGQLLVSNNVGIGKVSPLSKLDIAETWNSNITVTGASGTGTVATLTFATQTAVIPIGSTIVVANVNPTVYNGTFTVTASALTSVSYASSAATTYVSGGTLQQLFTAIKLNVTDTASNASSLLADFQVGGVSKFQIKKAGQFVFANSTGSANYFEVAASQAGVWKFGGGLEVGNYAGADAAVTQLQLGGWINDTYISRKAAASIRLGRADAGSSATVTIAIGVSAAVTWSNHGLTTGSPVRFTTTGLLPTGIMAGAFYYVILVGTNTFFVATSFANALAGLPITTSGSQSGVHTGFKGAIAQTLGVQSASTNTDFNGADFIIAGSQGTGQGAGGSIVFRTAPASASLSATQNALATAVTIDSTGSMAIAGGLTLGTALSIGQGGTGATTNGAARTNLGLGSGNSPTFTGLTLSGLTGYVYANGASPATVTLASTDATADTLVQRDISGNGKFNTLQLVDGFAPGVGSIAAVDNAIQIISGLSCALNLTWAPATPATNVSTFTFTGTTDATYTFPDQSGTVLLDSNAAIPATPDALVQRDIDGSGNFFIVYASEAVSIYDNVTESYLTISHNDGDLSINTPAGNIGFSCAGSQTLAMNGYGYYFPAASGNVLLSSGNLAGLTNVSAARSNLGVGTGVENETVTEGTTSRSLGLTDAGKYIRCTSTSAITITVPADSVTNFPVNSIIYIRRASTGVITLSTSGVTVNDNTSTAVPTGGVFALKKIAANTWDFI